MRLAEATQKIKELFKEHGLFHADKEAEFFVCDVLSMSLTDFVFKKDVELTAEQQQMLFSKAHRRARGEPLAYIVGFKDFFKSRFRVSPAVLIPRSDTETLVEEALRLTASPARIADLGTGSGCIGLSLMKEWPLCHLTAIDISPEALAVAKENAYNLGLSERVQFVCGDVELQTLSTPFDMIVSNPPYIATNDTRLEESVKLYEPSTALYAEDNGLYFYKKWTAWARKNLKAGGWLLYEIGEGQAADVQSICLQNGFKNIKIINDLAAKQRVIAAQS